MASSILFVTPEDISRASLSLRNFATVNRFKHWMLEIVLSNQTILQFWRKKFWRLYVEATHKPRLPFNGSADLLKDKLRQPTFCLAVFWGPPTWLMPSQILRTQNKQEGNSCPEERKDGQPMVPESKFTSHNSKIWNWAGLCETCPSTNHFPVPCFLFAGKRLQPPGPSWVPKGRFKQLQWGK